jgi:hypothetical protein
VPSKEIEKSYPLPTSSASISMALLTINISAQTVPAGPTVFILLGLKHSESAKAFDEKKE